MEDLYKFFTEFLGTVCRRAVSHWAIGAPAAAASESEQPGSLSTSLFGRAIVPIPATLVLSHTQFLLRLQVHLVSHSDQHESQWPLPASL